MKITRSKSFVTTDKASLIRKKILGTQRTSGAENLIASTLCLRMEKNRTQRQILGRNYLQLIISKSEISIVFAERKIRKRATDRKRIKLKNNFCSFERNNTIIFIRSLCNSGGQS